MRWGIAIVALLGLAAALVALLLSNSESPEGPPNPVAEERASLTDHTDEQPASEESEVNETNAAQPVGADEPDAPPAGDSTARGENHQVDDSTPPSDASEPMERVNVFVAMQPLRPRMPRPEFESLFPDYEVREIQINGSERREGGVIETGDGIEWQIAFDDNDIVAYIISDDPRLELTFGVHVGMHYVKLKEKFGDNPPYRIPGYGNFVSVAPLQWAVFEDKPGFLKDDDVVQRIELRDDMRF